MKKHFVTFCSPGTLFHETTEKEISSWNPDEAMVMAREIKERHGAAPFGFYFTTRERKRGELDSKQVARSVDYYLGGKIETLEEVEARNLPSEEILRFNMQANNINKIIVNKNSWKSTLPYNEGDVVLDWE